MPLEKEKATSVKSTWGRNKVDFELPQFDLLTVFDEKRNDEPNYAHQPAIPTVALPKRQQEPKQL